MFAKDAEKMESFLGGNSRFKGELTLQGTLRVDGAAEGRLEADCVILSERAVVKGEIHAQKIIVGGRVEGNLRAQDLVEIKSKGRVFGDIFTLKLAVSEGGEFNGKIEMKKKEEGKVIGIESKAKEV